MANHDLQFFSPLAVSGLSVGLNSFDLRQFTLPHYLSADHKERLAALLLSSLRLNTDDSPCESSGTLLRLRWEDREWLNAQQPPAIRVGHGDMVWLIVDTSVPERELLNFTGACNCLVLIDLRLPHRIERVEWMAKLKLVLLDAMQKWWSNNINQAEAGQVDFRDAGEWFDSPIDALDYCNAIASGLFRNHSLVYVERQGMSSILASKVQSLSIESVIALVAFALRERWQQLRFSEPMPLPDFASHFSGWQTAGLGWHVGAEFVPLNAVEKLAEREVLDPFFAHWDRQLKANAQLFNFWDKLRTVLAPPEPVASPMPAPDTTLRPPESMTRGGTAGTPGGIRRHIAGFFPNLSPDADDSILQEALAAETDESRRLLLLAWRASLWLDKAGDRSVTSRERLRAENDVTRVINDVWNRLNLKPEPSQPTFTVSENWARLRSALADHLTERARIGDAKRLNSLARDHFSRSLAAFHSLNLKRDEASVVLALGNLLMRGTDLAGARASYEKALLIYREIEEGRLGEANVLKALGDLLLYIADLAGAQASYENALLIYREIEDRLGEANALQAIGNSKLRMADFEAARESYEAALVIYREVKKSVGEANVLRALGDLKLHQGDLYGAEASYENALSIYRETEDGLGEANALQVLGDLKLRLADVNGAQASYESALAIYRKIETTIGEANVLQALGDVRLLSNDLAGARASYEAALKTCRQIKYRLGEANVLGGPGKLALAENKEEEADHLLEQAVAIYQEINSPYNIATQNANYGLTLLHQDRKEKARPYLLRASKLFEVIGLSDSAKQLRQLVEGKENA